MNGLHAAFDAGCRRAGALAASGRVNRAAPWAAAALLVLASLAMQLDVARSPGGLGIWWSWNDQSLYRQAAFAWAAGDLDPARQHYAPGYALLAAPFVRLMPWQPFLLPDLAALLGSLAGFVGLARRLLPGVPQARLAASASFLGGTIGSSFLLRVWVQPWTTTPAACLILFVLGRALAFDVRPRARDAALIGLGVGLLAAVRPSDAVLVGGCVGPALAVSVFARRVGWRGSARALAAGLGGCAAGLAPTVAAHLLVHGLSPGPYLAASAAVGFEPRLIPSRWITVFVSGRPLFDGDRAGLAARFPFIMPGIAGMVAAILSGRVPRRGHRLVCGTAAAYLALYLSYRDLHPRDLFLYENYHYFKWLMPPLLLYALLLAAWLARAGTRRRAWAGIAAALALLAWRVELVPGAAGPVTAETVAARRIAVPAGARRIDGALLVPATGTTHAMFNGPSMLVVQSPAPRVLFSTRDFKLVPVAGGFMFQPLRPLPPDDPAVLLLPHDVSLVPGRWREARQRIVPGLPCWTRFQPGCVAPTIPGTSGP